MKATLILAAFIATASAAPAAVAVPVELQERQCRVNGLECQGHNLCCSGWCISVVCGRVQATCQPQGTGCITRGGGK